MFRVRELEGGGRVVVQDHPFSYYARLFSPEVYADGIHLVDLVNGRGSNTMLGAQGLRFSFRPSSALISLAAGVATSLENGDVHPGELNTSVMCFGPGEYWRSLDGLALIRGTRAVCWIDPVQARRRVLCVLDQTQPDATFVYYGVSA